MAQAQLRYGAVILLSTLATACSNQAKQTCLQATQCYAISKPHLIGPDTTIYITQLK